MPDIGTEVPPPPFPPRVDVPITPLAADPPPPPPGFELVIQVPAAPTFPCDAVALPPLPTVGET